ncbi:hypothetical protein C8R43DRAFT_1236564 [Mycena crocata]|nr:hypothetical protein C8R43DRAFT_1236564 [Mycena crocata]
MARPPLHFLSLLCLTILCSAYADENGCKGRNAGKYYDLNGLQAGKDYTLKTPGGHEMVLSACKSVSHETWGLKVEDPALVGGFIRRDHGDFSMGKTNTTLSFSGRAGHPHLTLASGSSCRDSNGKTVDQLRGSTEIEFVCDPSAGAGSPRLVAQLPPGGDDAACAWFVEWRTKAACPTSEGVTFGGFVSFIIITALIILLTYVVLGTLYNHFVLQLQGADALPRFSIAGMAYHGREAWGLAGEWWASGGRRGGLSSTARGPVGLGGPGGFSSHGRSFGGGDSERAFGGDDERSFGGNPNNTTNTNNSHERVFGSGGGNRNGTANANPFVRTSVRKEQMQPQTNPASHQTQVMGGGGTGGEMTSPPIPSTGSGMGGMTSPPIPRTGSGTGPPSGMGLNPVSHQAQLMAGMPVPGLRQSSPTRAQHSQGEYRDENPSQHGGENPAQNPLEPAHAPSAAPAPAPAPARRDTNQTFALGDDDEDGPAEQQVADVRGRMGEEGGGVIRL